MVLMLLIGLIVGLFLGIKLSRSISKLAVSCYLISTGRTARASDDFARVILNGKYVEEFNKVRLNSLKNTK